MDRYKVLWIDDDPSDEFIGEAKDYYQIDIDLKTCHNDGIAALKNPDNFYHAIILDANCKITNDEQEKPSLKSLTESILEVHMYCTSKSIIPWYVYTGGGYEGFADLASRIPSKREWDDRKYYNKPKDRYELFDNLKKSVKQINSIEWRLWNKHRQVFEIFDSKSPFLALDVQDRSMLIKLLVAAETTEESSNPAHLNNIRKFVAGGVIKTLSNMGVIPLTITKINGKSSHLGDKRFTESIPVHVQRAFYAIVSTCQDGSHSGKEVEEEKIPPQIDRLVREGKAPYLLPSLVYEILNILVWLKEFMISYGDKEANLKNFNSIYVETNIEVKETKSSETIISKWGDISRREGENHAFLIVSEKERYYIKPDLVKNHKLINGTTINCEIGSAKNHKTGELSIIVIKIIE